MRHSHHFFFFPPFFFAGMFLFDHFSPFHQSFSSWTFEVPWTTFTSKGPMRATEFSWHGWINLWSCASEASSSSQEQSTNSVHVPSLIATNLNSKFGSGGASVAPFFFFFGAFGAMVSSTGPIRT